MPKGLFGPLATSVPLGFRVIYSAEKISLSARFPLLVDYILRGRVKAQRDCDDRIACYGSDAYA